MSDNENIVIKNEDENFKKALIYGVVASFFFAFTFVFNRRMNLQGSYWLWGACLRFFFMLAILYIFMLKDNRLKKVISNIKKDVKYWIIWSSVGFGMFYAPLCLASVYGQSWFVAACWQITIVCGALLTPLFGKPIPIKNILFGIFIIIGVFLMLYEPESISLKNSLYAIIPILIASFSYPLGNRKIMKIVNNELTTMQRVFGMTLCSMPFWIISAIISYYKAGMPTQSQLVQSGIIAVFSGVIATILFFKATDLVSHDHKKLPIIEASQCGEVIFALIGGVFLLGDKLPNATGVVGIGLIILGMILESIAGQ